MSESKELISFEGKESSLENAIGFVNRCRDLSIDQLVNQLDKYIGELRNAIKEQQWEEVEPVVHVIIKGFKRICQETDALKYYYLGYYSHLQEDLIESFTKNLLQDKLQQIVTTKHTQEILKFLFESGCSRQSDISKGLRINRSNLSKKMDLMVDNSLVIKRSAPKCVFYELSAKGYDLCRNGGVFKKSNNDIIDAKYSVLSRSKTSKFVCEYSSSHIRPQNDMIKLAQSLKDFPESHEFKLYMISMTNLMMQEQKSQLIKNKRRKSLC